VATLGPGQFLGEIALVDGKPRTASVVTEEPSHLIVLGHREFHSLLDRRPDVRLRVLEALAQRIRANQADPATD
jgi:CRP/FNR family cyclic AMP-dependent transcriptional regulator